LALGEPVFVGIARTDELSSYLGDVAHAKVTDFEYEPFEASYDRRGGKGKPDVPPGSGSGQRRRRAPTLRLSRGTSRTGTGRSSS
jgi:hypothetical protein